MILEILVAAIIGISFGNAWTCIFMSFGTSSEDKSVGKWFIFGRFLGLIVLGSVISLLRFAAQDAMPAILLIFGVSTILFGLFMLIKYAITNHFPKEHGTINPRQKRHDHIMLLLTSFFVVGKMGSERSKGGSNNGYSCKNPDSKTHDQEKRGNCKKRAHFKGKYGFTLGVLRGATPCLKIVVLAPLLVAVGFPSSLLLILVYASASSIYPIIGYLSADLLSNFQRYQRPLKILGAVILITIGAYSIMKVVMWDTTHVGG